MGFFNLGASELVLILILSILALGPKETVRHTQRARQTLQSVRGTLSELSAELGRAASVAAEGKTGEKS